MKSLNRSTQPKVTTRTESQNLTPCLLQHSFVSLRERELELGWLNKEEDQGDTKNLAVKPKVEKYKIPKEDENFRWQKLESHDQKTQEVHEIQM